MDTGSDPVTTTYLSSVTFSFLATLVAVLTALYYYIETSRAVRLVKKLPGMYILIIKNKFNFSLLDEYIFGE